MVAHQEFENRPISNLVVLRNLTWITIMFYASCLIGTAKKKSLYQVAMALLWLMCGQNEPKILLVPNC